MGVIHPYSDVQALRKRTFDPDCTLEGSPIKQFGTEHRTRLLEVPDELARPPKDHAAVAAAEREFA
jgi:hypothetical protein